MDHSPAWLERGPPISRPRRFGIVLTWPTIHNAEYEVVQRITKAAANIGVHVDVLDNDGFRLWSNAGDGPNRKARVTRDECEFVVSLHFESPRLFDIPSYSALWNPPDFFADFGYDRVINQLVSHSDVLSCKSDISDAHGLGAYAGFGRTLPTPLVSLFHSVPGPYPAPSISEQSRLFYIGINWERISGMRGRHQDLLERLDDEDLVFIYGPDLFQGIQPWDGFKTYRGPIPFDGESVVARINEAGICLALSSRSHQTSGIMSNRLFEGLAAGAVIIANPHPFIDTYFADCVYVIDDRQSTEAQNEQIRALVLHIRSNLDEALDRARRGQDRFKASFSLEQCLQGLLEAHPARDAAITTRLCGTVVHALSVILSYTGADPAVMDRLIGDVRRQSAVQVDLVIVCDAALHDIHGGEWTASIGGAIRSVRTLAAPFYQPPSGKDGKPKRLLADGTLMQRALESIETEFFCLLQEDDHWFSDHLASLSHALASHPETEFSGSGKLIERTLDPAAQADTIGPDVSIDDERQAGPIRHLEALAFAHFEQMLELHYPHDVGRFLYRSSLIRRLPSTVFRQLDCTVNQVLNLWAFITAPPAQTNFATYVQLADVTEALPENVFERRQQSFAIRDTVRGDNRWLMLLRTLRAPHFAPQALEEERDALQIGRIYAAKADGDGAAYLRDGFSKPEAAATWIDGRTGVLEFSVDRPVPGETLSLVLGVMGRRSADGGTPQTCTVVINGIVAERLELADTLRDVRIPIAETVDLEGSVKVVLRVAHAEPVLGTDTRKVIDKRQLGMQLASFGVVKAHAPVVLGQFYDLGHDGDGLEFLSSGFCPPEAASVWIDGPLARLDIPALGGQGPLQLVMVASGRRSDVDGAEQRCTVFVNDVAMAECAVAEHETQVIVPLPPLDQAAPVRLRVRLSLQHATNPVNAQGEVVDARRLGMRLRQIGLFKVPALAEQPVQQVRTLRSAAGRIRHRLSRQVAGG